MKKQKVVLAYSGGLDTSVILKWLEEEHDYDVIAVCVDVGQDEDFEAIKIKALNTGAKQAIVLDVKEEFINEYILPTLKAGAKYENKYLLGTSFARPLIAKKLVEAAISEGASAISHGATGKGNDQVRFEATIKALAPHIKIIAPWRMWDIKSREDAIDFAQKHNIPLPVTKKDIYSRDKNLWHLSHEGGDLESIENQHKSSIYQMCNPVEDAPDHPEYIEITFDKGVPIALDNVNYSPLEIIRKLNHLGGVHGIGVSDIVENRLVGMKSRGVYECPGGTILFEAHSALESVTLDRQTMAFKSIISNQYSQLVYDGLWFTPLREALDAFVDSIQLVVSGKVKMKLYKGSCNWVSLESSNSLYREDFVTFGEDEVYNQKDAEGFINLFTLPLKIRALMKESEVKDKKELKAI